MVSFYVCVATEIFSIEESNTLKEFCISLLSTEIRKFEKEVQQVHNAKKSKEIIKGV